MGVDDSSLTCCHAERVDGEEYTSSPLSIYQLYMYTAAAVPVHLLELWNSNAFVGVTRASTRLHEERGREGRDEIEYLHGIKQQKLTLLTDHGEMLALRVPFVHRGRQPIGTKSNISKIANRIRKSCWRAVSLHLLLQSGCRRL